MKQNKVELVTDGLRTLVFVDGVQLRHVLELNVPVDFDEIKPQITVTLHPEQINIRHVSASEFKSLKDGALAEVHKGERIIPAADNKALMDSIEAAANAAAASVSAFNAKTNAALSQGESIVHAPGWDDEPPSKRELLEQILAVQRNTNELLARMNRSRALMSESVLTEKDVRSICQLDESKAQAG